MGARGQNLNPTRYQIVPRVLVFAWRGEHVLLLKVNGKGSWDGYYNGLGGHIERGETTLAAARRELREESGLQADLRLVGTLLIDTGESPGIGLYIFSGEAGAGETVPSEEGELAWIRMGEVEKLPVFEDVPIFLEKILAMRPDDAPFSARSFSDAEGRLQVVFDV
jgi:8-oxo-dGTP diphosphatase